MERRWTVFKKRFVVKKVVRYWQFASTLVESRWRSPQNTFVPAVPQRADGAARQAEVEFLAMQSSRGQEGTSW